VTHSHAVAWIDHHEAHIIHFNLDESEASTVKSHAPHRHLHHKSGSSGAGHDKPDTAYLTAVAAAIADAGEILIAGPANAKNELMHYLKQHHADVAKKVAGVETVDHPSEGELLKFARKYFLSSDRMRSNSPAPVGQPNS
jgi:stalled ribosome rescue protein Dom34